MTKQKKQSRMLLFWVIVGISALIAFIVFIFTNNKTTVTQVASTNNSFLVLNCKATSKINSVMDSSRAESQTHEVKAVFKYDSNDNPTLSDLFYNFEGEYSSDKTAEGEMSAMHANYNIFMGNIGVDSDTYSPTFSHINNRAKYALYATSKNLQLSTLRIFALDLDSAGDLNLSAMKANYETNGFICSTEEKNN